MGSVRTRGQTCSQAGVSRNPRSATTPRATRTAQHLDTSDAERAQQAVEKRAAGPDRFVVAALPVLMCASTLRSGSRSASRSGLLASFFNGLLEQAVEQALQMIKVHVPDLDPTGLAGLVLGDHDRTAERAGQSLLEIAHRRRLLGSRRRAAVLGLLGLLDQRLGGAHRQLAVHPLARRPLDLGGLVEREQRAGVAHRQPVVLDQLADRRRQLEQPDRVGDRAAVLADPLGDRLLGQPELVDQPLVRRRLLERPEVGALQVLDQRALQRGALFHLLDDDRNLAQPAPLRPSPPPPAPAPQAAAARPPSGSRRRPDAAAPRAGRSRRAPSSTPRARRAWSRRTGAAAAPDWGTAPRSRRRSTSASAAAGWPPSRGATRCARPCAAPA